MLSDLKKTITNNFHMKIRKAKQFKLMILRFKEAFRLKLLLKERGVDNKTEHGGVHNDRDVRQ